MKIIVMNLVNGALTEYEHFPFNSFAKIGNRYFACGSEGNIGLVELTGPKDDTTSIDAALKFGQLDFKDSHMKRVPDVYIEAESDGVLNLHVYTDADEYVYPVNDIPPPMLNRKTLIGKGIRTRRWQFGISNQDGANFSIASMSVLVNTMERRV